MSTRQYKNSKLRRLYVPLICLILTSYFFYHSMIGHYGSHNHRRVVAQIEALRGELETLKLKRKELQKTVALLQNGTIERDMLDQQIRYHLNLIQSDEIVVLRSAQ